MASPNENLFSETGKYLLENENVHDCFFKLGEEKKRIGAAKLFLINQSRVWWSMLSEESQFADKRDIEIPDIEPDVFILLLKHCYGSLDDYSGVSDDMMLKLCYCADKYNMASLMKKITDRLKPTGVENVFPALHALTFFNLKGLEEATEKIVQSKTEQIFGHPQFLECHVESVTYIAKQETLNCEELDVWRAVVAWAKHQAGCEDGSVVRKFMLKPLQHVRLLILGKDALCDEVLTTEALTVAEISSLAKKNIGSHINTLSSKIEKRSKPKINLDSNPKNEVVDIIHEFGNVVRHSSSVSLLITKNKNMVLKAITCAGYISDKEIDYFGRLQDNPKAVVTISCLSSAYPGGHGLNHVVEYDKPIRFYHPFKIPLSDQNKDLVLLENSRYEIKLTFGNTFSCCEKPNCVEGHNFEHGAFYCSAKYKKNRHGTTPCHILQIEYIPL